MNKKVFIPLLLLGTFAFTSCNSDTIVGRPSWVDDPIVEGDDLKDNKLKDLYDAIKGLGDTNSNLLNKILFEISVKKLGSYENLYKFGHPTTIEDKEGLKAFLNGEGKVYKCLDTDKIVEKDGNDVKEALTEDEILEISQHNIAAQYNRIKEELYKKIYDEISGGSYNDDKSFFESRYVQSIKKELYDVDVTGVTLKDDNLMFAKKADVEDETYEQYVKRYVSITEDDILTNKIYKDYLTRKFLPDIYRTLLIENYVKDERFSALGRSYARKVNIITVPNGGSDYKLKVEALFDNFAKNYIIEKQTETYDFSYIENAMNGLVTIDNPNDPSYKLLNDANFPQVYLDDVHPLVWGFQDKYNDQAVSSYVFKGTKLGDLVEKYKKIYDLKYTEAETEKAYPGCNFSITPKREKKDEAETAYNDLTNNCTYPLERGLKIKEREIITTTYTKSGWFLKNGGLTDLNATFRDRLFNIQTSNIVDSNKDYEAGDFVKYYNGKAFLTTKTQSTSGEEGLIVLNDDSNLMICEIEDAVKTSKLSTDKYADGSYLHLGNKGVEGINRYNDIARDIIKQVATGDTYKKSANEYYLILSNIVINDQAVFDYIKSQYPELFY